jgi:hypothetical protein
MHAILGLEKQLDLVIPKRACQGLGTIHNGQLIAVDTANLLMVS